MRKIGKRRFVLVYGVFVYGISVFLIWTLVLSIEERDWLSPLDLLEVLLPSLLFGLGYGLMTWKICERKCNELIGACRQK